MADFANEFLDFSQIQASFTEEELSKLFTQYFQRGKEAEKLYTTGRGIGLVLAKNIINAHEGKVWAESGGRGKGARFVVELLI